VIEAGAVDVFVFQELEDSAEVLGGMAGEGQAKADFLTGFDAVAEAAHGSLESAGRAAEFIMDGGNGAIQADADVGKFQVLESPGLFGVDQGSVGAEHDVQIEGAGIFGQLEYVRTNQRFAAGKQDGRNLERGQIVQDGFALSGGKFVGIFLGG